MTALSIRHSACFVSLACVAAVATLAALSRCPDVNGPAPPRQVSDSASDQESVSIVEPTADAPALTDSVTEPTAACEAPSPEPMVTGSAVGLNPPPVASPVHGAFQIIPTRFLASDQNPERQPRARTRPERVLPAPTRSLQDLESDLALAAEVALQPPHDRTRLFATPPVDRQSHPALTLLDNRADLRGLPALRGAACTLSPSETTRLRTDSGLLRQTFLTVADYLSRPGIHTNPPPDGLQQSRARRDRAGIRPGSVGLMSQMLQCAEPPMRQYLIEQLRVMPGRSAGEALAKRALYEMDPALRQAAVRALRSRPRGEARDVLLAGFGHPWPPVADHAAEALTSLQDRAAVPALRALLNAPNPAGPVPDADGRPVMRQVVRINHARNCQLCHATSWNASDPIRIAVPSPDEPLPPSFSVVYYSPPKDSAIVRAEVTYLRQDFSWMLRVPEPGPWPAQQRYDFFVRSRPAEPAEEWNAALQTSWPQREAIRRALAQFGPQRFGERTAN